MKIKLITLGHIISTLLLIVILSFDYKDGIISSYGLISTMSLAVLFGVLSVFRKSVWKTAQSNKENLILSFRYFASIVVVVAVAGSIINDLGFISPFFDYPKFLSWIIVYSSVSIPSIVYIFNTNKNDRLVIAQ